ncbi:DUF4870 domain-containing protein [Granulicoccus phenolivorans]|uniref:DUF4870 domain-containing protein n=1 Tax=Granulicoccus phenolivorans TaxID=266854 RepID=UPI00040F0684|nr:DUF4870 domain-containing protein [Granulicoccus phenolivorans]
MSQFPQYGQQPEYGVQPQYGQQQYGQQPQYGQYPQYIEPGGGTEYPDSVPGYGAGYTAATYPQQVPRLSEIPPLTPIPGIDPADIAQNKDLAAFAHWGTIFLGFLAPVIVLLAKPDSKYAQVHAKEALNFGVWLLIGYVVSVLLWFVIVGMVITAGLLIYQLVASIGAAGAAQRGVMPRIWMPFRVTN